jgi:2-(1,2-epoxy-1,2-dihydrophenyl)acetyl-CoA isomerase
LLPSEIPPRNFFNRTTKPTNNLLTFASSPLQIMSETLISEVEAGVGRITLNRPQVFNSFNREMALALQDKLKEMAAEENVRVIVLTGNGKAFCAGQDLAEASDPNGPGLQKILSEHYNPIITLIRTIGAVNGVAAGAGANIALACDIVVSTSTATFIQAFSKIGLIPDSGGTFFLPRLIGFQKASALMMLGDKIGAEQAEELGMIYKAFADESFPEEVNLLAEKVAAMPTYGLGLTKRALNASMHNSLEAQLDLEQELQIKAGQSHDYKEGVASFLEKRKPSFIGK